MADRDRRLRRVRRSWTDDEKRAMVAETRAPGVSVSAVARRHGLNANQLFNWINDPRFGGEVAPMLPVDVASDEPPHLKVVDQRVEIELPSGARLRCAADIDRALLTRLLSAIERAP